MNDKIIKIESISKFYGETKALNDVSFDVSQGDFLTIMGPSGCGKSTLLYLIGGLDSPYSGTINVFGKDINNMNDSQKSSFRRDQIGFIFQFFNLIPNLSIEENILVPPVMAKEKISLYSEKLNELLELTGLSDKRKAYPNELSGGQQQRAAIARALIMTPPIILADEPTGNLDHSNAIKTMQLFQEINKTYGTTIVQVSHSREMAEYSQKIVNLLDGKIVSTEIL